MENVSKAGAAVPDAHPLDRRLRLVPPSVRDSDGALLFKRTPRTNLLLIGAGTRVLKALEVLLPNLREPITVWFPGNQLMLPPVAQIGTLILHEVGALELGEQYRLHEWIERAQGRIPGTQIVSTSEASLLPRVHAGVFLDTLYYRLNTVYIDISA